MDGALISVSPATEHDREFSFQVKKAAEGELIAAVFGWNEEFEREFHANEWRDKRPDIIRYDGTPVGTIRTRVEEGCLHIGQFFILPEYQNRGIGSYLLGAALGKADHAGITARLAFLEGNRAESLYRRFGFEVLARRDKFCHMERRPRAAQGKSNAGGGSTT